MTQEEFQRRYKYNPNADCLGEGGFGKVYKAHDIHFDKFVAIKMAEVKRGLEQVRLSHEVELVNSLPNHINIAQYDTCLTFSTFTGEYDFGILKYFEHGNLQQLMSNKQLTYYQKDSMLKQILEGIIFLHSQAIIHRDLKPQNILIDTNKNGLYVPKIADFGISKKLDINKSSVFTNSLAGAGTLSFASPEQLTGQTIRKNADLWSFGVIACWMFTGKLPFNSGSLAATSEAGRIELYRQITAGDVTSIIAQLPADWRNLVKQCLVVDVEKRISSAGKCLDILSGKVRVEEIKDTNATKITQNQQNGNQKTNYEQTKAEEIKYKPVNKKQEPNYSAIWIIVAVIFVGWAIVSYVKTKVKPAESASMIDSTLVGVNTTVSSETDELPITTENKDINPTVENETVTDVDGNVYKTVKIGNQVWMAENLNVTHYRNGDAIPKVSSDYDWENLTSGALCEYNNDDSNRKKYGNLYNWLAVNEPRRITPQGWHIPSNEEWTILLNNLGENEGGKLKETSTMHWTSPNTGATNQLGFTALPGGDREKNGGFWGISKYGGWWSSSKSETNNASCLYLYNDDSSVDRDSKSILCGLSVRCIKD